MKKDIFVLANIVGFGSTIIDILLSYILKSIGLIKTPLYIFVGKLSVGEISSPEWIITIIGILGHLMTGIIFAFGFIYVLQKWGNDYIYLKGLEYGGLLWIIHEIIIPNIITTDIELRVSASSQFFHLFAGLIWGLTAAYIYSLIIKKRNRQATG